MQFFQEILSRILQKEEIYVSFPTTKTTVSDIIETESYKTLEKIKAIIENDSLSDFECIEQIVCVFEEIGSNGGNHNITIMRCYYGYLQNSNGNQV